MAWSVRTNPVRDLHQFNRALWRTEHGASDVHIRIAQTSGLSTEQTKHIVDRVRCLCMFWLSQWRQALSTNRALQLISHPAFQAGGVEYMPARGHHVRPSPKQTRTQRGCACLALGAALG